MYKTLKVILYNLIQICRERRVDHREMTLYLYHDDVFVQDFRAVIHPDKTLHIAAPKSGNCKIVVEMLDK